MLMEPNCILLGKTINYEFTIKKKDIIHNDNYNDLNLWKIDIALSNKLENLTEEQIFKNGERLSSFTHLKEYFPDLNTVNNSIIVVQLPNLKERTRKPGRTKPNDQDLKKKERTMETWTWTKSLTTRI
ncbi:unnamed protein product [Rhizophagus irregularis]|nr:unnamed protein product [Rhizophagus irregularis]